MSLFFSNQTVFFNAFLRAISFFQKSLSIFPQFQDQHFAGQKRIGVPPKEEKCHLFFPSIELHFFMGFYVPFQFFKVPFDFSAVPKQAFCKAKA